MPSVPKLVTICPDCGREDVGVVRDWTSRDANDQILEEYRMSRHKVEYVTSGHERAKNKQVPYCINSRSVVPKELVFDRKTI